MAARTVAVRIAAGRWCKLNGPPSSRPYADSQANGRVPGEKWATRTLDIDILFYGEQIIKTPDLTIPHPEIANRRFTLEPLMEVEPDLVHPVLNKTVRKLLAICKDGLPVEIYR